MIAFVTYEGLPELTPSDQVGAEALRKRGAEVQAMKWDDAAVDWSAFDAVILRSCWDYYKRMGEFSRWLDALAGANVWNPVELVKWNADKAYLFDFEKWGVPIIPTVLIKRGENASLAEILRGQGWDEAVVKPTVSATAYQTWRVAIDQGVDQQSTLTEMLTQSDVLVQKFLPEITTRGEWSFLFFDGEYSHAVLKRAKTGDFRVQSDFGGKVEMQTPDASMIEQAKNMVSKIPQAWLYARVDVVEVEGQLLLMEMELIEPDLFLDTNPDAANRLAEAILQRLMLIRNDLDR